MTENKKDNNTPELDFDNELSSLEDFLKDDIEADAFPLDDEPEEFYAPEPRKSRGKLLGSVALIALLCGGVYAGMTYVPSLMSSPELSEFEQVMADRSQNFSDSLNRELPVAADMPIEVVPVTATSIAEVVEIAEQATAGDTVSDLVIQGDIVVSDGQNDNGLGLDVEPQSMVENAAGGGVTVAEIGTDNVTEAAPAVTEESAMPAPESAGTEVVDVMQTSTAEDIVAEDDILPAISQTEVPFAVERIPASPMRNTRENDAEIIQTAERNASIDAAILLEGDQQEQAEELARIEDQFQPEKQEITETPVIAETQAVPEAQSEEVTQIVPILAPDAMQETDAGIATVVEDTETESVKIDTPQLPQEEIPVKVQDIAKVEAKPISEPAAKPQPKQESVAKIEDPRVNRARIAYEQGDLAQALSLYDAILAGDRGNTAALMGRQLVISKLRLQSGSAPQVVVNAPQQSVVAPPSSMMPIPQDVQPVVQPSERSTNVQTLLDAMQSNPRDAATAMKLGQAYQQSGNKAQAIEWYRKALQLDAIYNVNLNRAAVYDALAELQ